MSRFTIYGPRDPNTSWGRVAHGLASGLRAIDQLNELVAVDDFADDLDGPVHAGFDASDAIFVGPPHRAITMLRGKHRQRWLMIAPNSTWLPSSQLRTLSRGAETTVRSITWTAEGEPMGVDQAGLPGPTPITGILTPSRWGKGVLDAYGDADEDQVKTRVWQHGVDPEFAAPWAEDVRDPDGFRLLHLSTTLASRKGTRLLIEAWHRSLASGLPPTSHLRLVCDGPERYARPVAAIATAYPGTISLQGRVAASPAVARDIIRQHHFVIQPSRAEGFGLVPLEARVAGVPVIATTTTGHSEHMAVGDPGVIHIETGPYASIDDGPGATAPTLSVRAICEGLVEAFERTADATAAAKEHAAKLADTWSWESVCRRFCLEHP